MGDQRLRHAAIGHVDQVGNAASATRVAEFGDAHQIAILCRAPMARERTACSVSGGPLPASARAGVNAAIAAIDPISPRREIVVLLKAMAAIDKEQRSPSRPTPTTHGLPQIRARQCEEIVARDGIEPPTLRFSVACSTN